MANIRLHGADVDAMRPEHIADCRRLDWVTNGSSRAMTLGGTNMLAHLGHDAPGWNRGVYLDKSRFRRIQTSICVDLSHENLLCF
jgi:hypothetical protein